MSVAVAICSDADVWDVDPLMVSTDPPMGADIPHLEVIRVLKRCKFVRHLPGGRFIAVSR